MNDSGDQKKTKMQPTLGVVRGGRYATRPMRTFSTAEFRLDREMQAAFSAIYGEDETVPSVGIYKIRKHDQHPWRVLARRILEARAANAPKDQLRGVLKVFETWVDGLYNEQQPDRAA